MAIEFPSNPSEGDEFPIDNYLFIFENGRWVTATINPNFADFQGATGATGADSNVAGPPGATGASGTDGTPGTPGTPGAAGATGPAGANAIGQVQSTASTARTALTDVRNWTDIPGITVTATPSSASSKFLVMVKLTVSTGANDPLQFRLIRNGSSVGNGADAGSRRGVFAQQVNTTPSEIYEVNHTYLDSPSTTGAVTYKVQARGGYNFCDLYVNRNLSDADATTNPRSISTITALEVL